ncbi:hypothetical protein [Archangium sp.]|nr:hypothetical protein [Archangium sp.]
MDAPNCLSPRALVATRATWAGGGASLGTGCRGLREHLDAQQQLLDSSS